MYIKFNTCGINIITETGLFQVQLASRKEEILCNHNDAVNTENNRL